MNYMKCPHWSCDLPIDHIGPCRPLPSLIDKEFTQRQMDGMGGSRSTDETRQPCLLLGCGLRANHDGRCYPGASTNDLFDRTTRIRDRILGVGAEVAYDGARWLAKHAGHRLIHNVRGFRCFDCFASGSSDASWLTAAAWHEGGPSEATVPSAKSVTDDVLPRAREAVNSGAPVIGIASDDLRWLCLMVENHRAPLVNPTREEAIEALTKIWRVARHALANNGRDGIHVESLARIFSLAAEWRRR